MTDSTDRQRWRRVEALVASAWERPAGRRAAFLRESCGGDAGLLEEALSLLRADHDAGRFLEAPALGDLRLQAPEELGGAAARLLDRSIGPYRLERVIASGGMGTVYLGVADDDRHRARVAVKVIRQGMDTEVILRRFDTERQVLASLEHPNIAHLLDGGTTDDGLPYLILEYVEGVPVDVFCDDAGLSVRRRLELFRTICSAVQYAHHKLVVHRDIKPGNILVTADGTPKLLDFGIAKILTPDRADSGVTTAAHRFLSPEYASPEQIRGAPITTSTDVYSLGVTLYGLLAGRRPFDLTGRSPAEIERLIVEQDPPRPSVAVGSGGPAAIGIAAREGVARLRRSLAGDLDTIVLTALRKKPEERYASVEQMSEDIRRHLEGRPVLARRPTAAYRMGKFLRRNAAMVGVGVLLVLSIAVGAVGIVRESRRARHEAELSRRVLSALDGLFADFDPRAAGAEVTVRDVLDRGSERVMNQLEDAPGAQAMLAERIAGAYRGLGLEARSVPWLERALTLYRRQYGDDDPRVAATLHDLGFVLRAIDSPRAERLLRDALAERRRMYGEESAEMASTLHALGIAMWRQGKTAEAEPLLRRALELRRGLHPEPHPEVVEGLRVLSLYLLDNGRYGEAEELLREGVVLADRLPGSFDAQSIRSYLAGLLQDTGRYDEAEPYLRRGLEAARRRLGPDHPDVAAEELKLALLLKDMGEIEQAERLGRRALALLTEVLGPGDGRRLGDAWFVLAKILSDKGDLAGAEAACREALGRAPTPAARARRLTLLARTLVEAGRSAEAEPLAREALALHRRTLPAGSWKIAKAASVLGAALTGLGRFAEAEPLLLDSYPVIRDDRGPAHPRTRQALERLVLLYESWGRPEAADRYRDLLRTATAATAGGGRLASR